MGQLERRTVSSVLTNLEKSFQTALGVVCQSHNHIGGLLAVIYKSWICAQPVTLG